MVRSTTRFGTLCLILLMGAVFARPTLGQAPARTESDTVPLASDGEVTLDNHEGTITVTTWDRETVQYEAEIMPTDEDPNAEKVSIRVYERGGRLEIETEHEEGDDESKIFGFGEDGWQWGGIDIPAVHYTIRMPPTARLVVDDHESTIDVRGLQSEIRINTHEGSVHLTDHRGDVTIDSHDSRIELGRVVGNVNVETHDGDLTVDELEGGLRFDSHDGYADVTFTSLADDVSIDTHDGDATLSLPAGTGFDIYTDVDDDADIRSDFDLSPVRIMDEDDEDDVNYRGDINGGGPEIFFDSHDGDLTLRSQ